MDVWPVLPRAGIPPALVDDPRARLTGGLWGWAVPAAASLPVPLAATADKCSCSGAAGVTSRTP